MKSEKIKYPKEKELLQELPKTASEARRFYLKYEVFDDVMSLLTIDEERSETSKWERLYKLQKRINIVKYDLGANEANVLIQEVIETLSEYLNKNSSFREEAFENVKMLFNIQKKKVKTLKQIFRMESDN
jgi:hypothetical protein